MNVLLLDGNTRQSLPMVKALSQKGHKVTLLCIRKSDLGYKSRWPTKKLLGPDPKVNDRAYIDNLLSILQSDKYDILIPLFDYSAEIVSRNKDELGKFTKVAVNDWDIFVKARNKLYTMRECENAQIPHPKTIFSDDPIDETKKKLSAPVVVKPKIGDSAKGFHRVDNLVDLEKIYNYTEEKYGNAFIQEYIPQDDLQYKCELYVDKNSNLIAAIVFAKIRWYPIDGGSSTLNVTVDRLDIIDICYNLVKNINWVGYADVDLIQDPRDNLPKVMEINPRITGSVKIAFKAGIDFANIIVNDTVNGKLNVQNGYEKGIYLRFFHKDILWFFKSPDRFRTNPSWFNFRNTCDQIIDFSDPLPSIFFTYQSLSQLFKDR